MARSIVEIYNEMSTEKDTMTTLSALQPNIDSGQQLLSDLTTQSKVAVWRLLFFVIAVSIWSLEKLFDEHVIWINNRATEITTGTLAWYQRMTLLFQYGDSLVFTGDNYAYSPVNETNRVVKLASVNEVGGIVIIKSAKLDGGGLPIPLDTPELSALDAYWQKVKFAGVRVQVVSRPADLLHVEFKVYYNPLVLNSGGELISSPGTYPVNDAINNYIKGLPFNGVYSITELTDKVQLAIGVVNPVHMSSEAKYGTNPYLAVVDYYQPNAGYLQIDPSYPLSGTITYIAAS